MKSRIIRPNIEKRSILPRIGFIKTGEKSEKGYPRSLDYFVCSSNYQRYFDEVYKKPSTIQIAFYDEDPAVSCDERYILIDKDGKRFAYGDGQNFKIWNGKNYQDISLVDYPNAMELAEKRAQSKKGWEVTLTMRFIIPAIPKILGHWELNTKGNASSIPNIRNAFDMVLENRGSVLGVMFDLNVQFAKSQKPNDASRYPVIQLVPNHMPDNIELMKNSMTGIAFDQKKSIGNNQSK